MKGYLVDTNIPSELTQDHPDIRVVTFLRTNQKDSIFLGVLTIGEICKGIALLAPSHRRNALQDWLDLDVRAWYAGRILPVTEAIAERWGNLAAVASQQGITVNIADGLIAATAMEHGLTVVTRNVKDFKGLGLDIFNPWEM